MSALVARPSARHAAPVDAGADAGRCWCAVVGTVTPSSCRPRRSWCWPRTPRPCSCSPPASAFVIMLGGIDLSIQSMASLASVIVALDHAALRLSSASPLATLVGALAGIARRPRPRQAAASPPSSPRSRSAACSPAPRWSSREARSITLGEDRARLPRLDHRHAASACRTRSSSAPSCCSSAHLLQSRTRFGRYSAADRRRRGRGLRLGRQGRPPEGHRLHALRRASRASPA